VCLLDPGPALHVSAMNILKKPILMLVSNDSETLDRLLSIFRAREPMVDVIGVDSSEKALECAIHHPITAVAVDEHLSEGSGTELLAMVRKVRPELMGIVMYEPREQGPARPTDCHVIEKTSDSEGVVARLASCLSEEEEQGFSGILDKLELPEILQLLCLRRETTQVRIAAEKISGIIVIEGGQIVHARTSAMQGEEAFHALFGLKGGSFRVQQRQESSKRTIHKPWESLLMEAGQFIDEAMAREELIPAGGEVVECDTGTSSTPAISGGGGASSTDHTRAARDDLCSDDAMPIDGERDVPPSEEAEAVEEVEAVEVEEVEDEGGGDEGREAIDAVADSGQPALPVPDVPAFGGEVEEVAEENTVAVWSPIQACKGAEVEEEELDPPMAPLPSTRVVETQPEPDGAVRARSSVTRKTLRDVAAVTVILVMFIPVIRFLTLALPWLWTDTEMEVYLNTWLAEASVPNVLARNGPGVPVVEKPEPLPEEWSGDAGVCSVRIAPLVEFAHSGNLVAVAADTFNALDLQRNPWVELIAPNGARLGALAIRKQAAPSTLYLRRTMALALAEGGPFPTHVKVEPVNLSQLGMEDNELVFNATKTLANPYCEYWYSVGVSLQTMQEANLTPGSYAIAKGPDGFQSVQVQVMDRGNPDEIWLGKTVRETIGVRHPGDTVVLYLKEAALPKAASSPEGVAVLRRVKEPSDSWP